jgi:hypothetical protein
MPKGTTCTATCTHSSATKKLFCNGALITGFGDTMVGAICPTSR